ncbi:hypothetical protein RRG08_011737 [Elysia crispata]|uniref:Uncharacterized protein n=1 Tax=Elysia crispata TaxID=231223 RepID=A0AAE1DX88_9GAST|nr:hypothetical protein RRG08_011737 [Elysia crispata]
MLRAESSECPQVIWSASRETDGSSTETKESPFIDFGRSHIGASQSSRSDSYFLWIQNIHTGVFHPRSVYERREVGSLRTGRDLRDEWTRQVERDGFVGGTCSCSNDSADEGNNGKNTNAVFVHLSSHACNEPKKLAVAHYPGHETRYKSRGSADVNLPSKSSIITVRVDDQITLYRTMQLEINLLDNDHPEKRRLDN